MKTLSLSGFLLLILMTALTASAQNRFDDSASCTPRDYRAAVGPNRDQNDLSWCYAFASADLVTQRTGLPVSAVDLASGFLLSDGPSLWRSPIPAVRLFLQRHPGFDAHLKSYRWDGKGELDSKRILTSKGLVDSGGTEDATLLLANLRGLCLERDLPSKGKAVMSMMTIAAREHATRSREIGSPARRAQNDTTSAILDPVAVAKGDVFAELVEESCRRVPSPVPLIPRVLQWTGTVGEYREALRTGRLRVDREGVLTIKELNRALGSNRIAAIGWGADSIMTPDGGDDDHSSVIVGRRMIGGVCHYLLRNSYGEDCSEYRPEYRSRCERGNVWLTADELVQTVYAVTTLE